MKETFDRVSLASSKTTTRAYSTSFSMGIYCLGKRFHDPVYSIYGFVRFADEIVDTFHDYNKEELLHEFERDTYLAIERKISMNPILNSFQSVVRQYNIPRELIDSFLASMKCDLTMNSHQPETYNEYIFGSAEVVGLMCLRVFADGDDTIYEKLKPSARKLGAAFQKVNFLRDIKSDYEYLGRVYFPGLNIAALSESDKRKIEEEIEAEFAEALAGIRQLPQGACFGVYVAYMYYRSLFAKIKSVPSARIMVERIRISNYRKILLLFGSYFRHSFRMI
jgi:phytoene synthase